MTEIVSRDEAVQRGLTRYFTGRPCQRGHVAERTTRDWGCVACEKLRYAERLSIPGRRERPVGRLRGARLVGTARVTGNLPCPELGRGD